MPYLLFMSYRIMWTLISLPLQMVERLRRAQPDSVANHVKARQSLIERSVTWLATESDWARRKRSAICSGKLCGGFIIFEQCCPSGRSSSQPEAKHQNKESNGKADLNDKLKVINAEILAFSYARKLHRSMCSRSRLLIYKFNARGRGYV